MAIDVNKEIRRAVDTGKVFFGKKESEKSVLKGKAEIMIFSKSATKLVREKLSHLLKATSTPVYEFTGTGLELGAVCGKPFTVSVMVIQKSGKSKILSAVK